MRDEGVQYGQSAFWTWDEPMWERLRWLRTHDPVHWSEPDDLFVLSRFEEVALVSKDHGRFCSGHGVLPLAGIKLSLIDEDARFTDGHLRIGVGAGDHALICWPLLCGMAKAKYYLLTADFIDGRTADQIGLVSKALPGADLLDEAQKLANRLATGPQHALQLTKRSLNLWLDQAGPTFDASLAFEMLGFLGPEAKEGVAAMKQRRRPDFG